MRFLIECDKSPDRYVKLRVMADEFNKLAEVKLEEARVRHKNMNIPMIMYAVTECEEGYNFTMSFDVPKIMFLQRRQLRHQLADELLKRSIGFRDLREI